ncbi:MAG: Lysine exporter protein [Firmicutes bacterium]|nr:Lysine exporter protein [Bacillota bacterium]
MLVAFMHGFILALGLILPLGVQNVFIFSQGAYQSTWLRVFPAVIAAAISDTVLIVVAVQGVSLVVLSYAWLKVALLIVGIVFISYMGWLTWKNSDYIRLKQNEAKDWSLWRQVLFALSVSILNPHAILDTIGVIGTSSLSYGGEQKIAFMTACILVSWCWFTLLASMGRIVRTLDRSGYILGLLNRFSAIIMWISGAYLIYLLKM